MQDNGWSRGWVRDGTPVDDWEGDEHTVCATCGHCQLSHKGDSGPDHPIAQYTAACWWRSGYSDGSCRCVAFVSPVAGAEAEAVAA